MAHPVAESRRARLARRRGPHGLSMQFMTPTRGTIAPGPNRTREFMPYKKVDMPVVAKYRGGAEATTWQPPEEAVEARAEKLRYEDTCT